MTTSAKVAMAEMSWMEYAERVVTPGIWSIVPVGAIEQHGPHLPLNTDVLMPTEIALGVGRRINGIVAPAITYGYKSVQRSGGGNHFPGTTSLDGNTLSCMARDILRELARHGARRVLLLNGHFENVYFLLEGADLAIRELKSIGIDNFEVVTLTYWDFIVGNALKAIFPEEFLGWAVEHGGVMETSLMLHFYPQLVDMKLVPEKSPIVHPAYDVLPPDPEMTPPSGCLLSAKDSSAEKGKVIFECVVSGVVGALAKRKPIGR
jgi:creatinine amidohydrolase